MADTPQEHQAALSDTYPSDHPGEQIPSEALAEAAPAKQSLRDALRQIQTPEQAREIVDAVITATGDTSVIAVQEDEEGETSRHIDQVQDATARLGVDQAATVLLEAARDLETSEDETRRALERALQEATNPEQQEEELDPTLRQPLELLREAILERMEPLEALDTRLFLAINHLPHPRIANRLMQVMTMLMNAGWGWIVGLLIASLVDKQRGRMALRHSTSPLWFATMVVEYPIKRYFRRRRPFVNVVQAISVGRKPVGFSFPSGHSASAFAGAWLISRYYPELQPLWYTIAATIGFSRVYLGVHYPGDVVSGGMAGIVIAEAVRWMVDYPDEIEAREPQVR